MGRGRNEKEVYDRGWRLVVNWGLLDRLLQGGVGCGGRCVMTVFATDGSAVGFSFLVLDVFGPGPVTLRDSVV